MSVCLANAYTITTRFRNGVQNNFLDRILKYLKKQWMVFLVSEKTGKDKHLHFQIWYEKPKKKDDLRKSMMRIIKETVEEDAYEFPHCLKVDGCYNDNFHRQYMLKGDDTEILLNTRDEEQCLKFIYTHKKNDGEDKRPLMEQLTEACEGQRNVSVITGTCISYCIQHNKYPRKDQLKNMVWWIWMINRGEDDRFRGEEIIADLKEKLRSPLKIKYKRK